MKDNVLILHLLYFPRRKKRYALFRKPLACFGPVPEGLGMGKL
jgi:hypothetical protein